MVLHPDGSKTCGADRSHSIVQALALRSYQQGWYNGTAKCSANNASQAVSSTSTSRQAITGWDGNFEVGSSLCGTPSLLRAKHVSKSLTRAAPHRSSVK